MSKNKDKHHSQEDAAKNRTAPAGHAPTPDGRTPDDGRQPAQRLVNHSLGDGGSPEGESGTAAGASAPQAAAAPAGADIQAGKKAQLEDRLLRLQADFDNFRKRTLREKNELFDSANQALMLELLPVLDHLQLGIQAAAEHRADKAFQEGLTLILDQLMGVLSKFGLSTIATEKQIFDPNRFEAVNSLPSTTAPEGTVLNQVRHGYMLRNKLLRPAQVIVSSGPPAPATMPAPKEPPDQDSALADEA